MARSRSVLRPVGVFRSMRVLRSLGPPIPMGPRGSITAEVAIALPAVVLALAVVLAVAVVASAQVRCVDAARAGARAAARGEPAARVSAVARGLAPGGARVSVDVAGASASVTVLAPLRLPLPGHPGLTVRATAVADVEQPIAAGSGALKAAVAGRPAGRERGSGTVLMLAPVTVGLVLAAALGTLGQAVLARHRAEASADLAALAAAARWDLRQPGACGEAARVASGNGTRLVSCRPASDGTVLVAVVTDPAGPGGVWGPASAGARAGPPGPARSAGW